MLETSYLVFTSLMRCCRLISLLCFVICFALNAFCPKVLVLASSGAEIAIGGARDAQAPPLL